MAQKDFPDHAQADISLDAYLERMEGLEKLLTTKFQLEKHQAIAALTSADPDAKENPAACLRAELRRLQSVQGEGGHPVRRGKTLSRLEIADLTFTMLESTKKAPGDQLLSLLQELLNVDRHRRAIALNRDKFDDTANDEAQAVLLGGVPTVRDLARKNSISVSTASQWKQSIEYRERVEFYKQLWSKKTCAWVGTFKRMWPEITEPEAFRFAMRVLADPTLLRPPPLGIALQQSAAYPNAGSPPVRYLRTLVGLALMWITWCSIRFAIGHARVAEIFVEACLKDAGHAGDISALREMLLFLKTAVPESPIDS